MDNKYIIDIIRDIRTVPGFRLEEVMQRISYNAWKHGYSSTSEIVRREISKLSMPIILSLSEMGRNDA